MDKEKRGGQARIQPAAAWIVFDAPEQTSTQYENQNSIQKMQQEIDQVITPNFLPGPDVVQGEREIKDSARRLESPLEFTKTDGCVGLDCRQIIKDERNVERVPIGDRGQ